MTLLSKILTASFMISGTIVIAIAAAWLIVGMAKELYDIIVQWRDGRE